MQDENGQNKIIGKSTTYWQRNKKQMNDEKEWGQYVRG